MRIPPARRLLCCLLAAVLACLATFAFAEDDKKSLLDGSLSPQEISAVADAFVEEHRETTSGAAYAVLQGPEVLLERYVGRVNLAEDIPADAASVFEWGSVTKLLVWTSVMQLVERGDLSLEEDIRTYLPEGFLRRLACDDPITMLHLMHHNAGWEENLVGVFQPSELPVPSLAEALREAEPRQVRRPGEAVGYSNFGVALAGYIVECVTGQPFYAYVHTHIFAPLGMEHTALHPLLEDNAWVRERRASMEAYEPDGTPVPNHFSIPLYPAGMATGTLSDFILFAQALLPGDGAATPLFVDAATLPEMLSATLTYSDSTLPRNSHGFWWLDFGLPLLGHGGNTAGFSSCLLLHPESGYGFVAMVNQPGEADFTSVLPTRFFGTYTPASNGGTLPDATALRGTYRSSRITGQGATRLYALLMTIPMLHASGDTLKASLFGKDLMVLRQKAPHIFVEGEDNIMPVGSTVYAATRPDGRHVLEMPYMEFIQMPTWQAMLEYLSVLLLVLAVLYCAILPACRLAGFLVRKIRGKVKPGSRLRKLQVAQSLVVVLGGINIALLAVRLMSSAVKPILIVHLAPNALCALCAVIGLVLYFRWKGRAQDSRGARFSYACTALATLVFVLFLGYWQMFFL